MNGLPFKHDHFLIDLYLQGMKSFQSINLTNPAIWQRFLRAMRRFDQLGTIQLGYVKKQEYDKSIYRPGGVMAWTHGMINSGRVCDRSSDAYGRWSSLTMLQKDEQKTMFIVSTYKDCKGPSGNLNFSFQVPFFIVLLPHIIFNRTV